MITDATTRARNSRNSGAVLKAELITIRSRNRSIPVLVFEGDTDVGPYSVWISRARDDWNYVSLPGKGKDQVLDLRERLANDTTEVKCGVFFVVDRDFDDLRNQLPGPDVCCTESYSTENYLVSESILMNVLIDEFRCATRHETRTRILDLFRVVLE